MQDQPIHHQCHEDTQNHQCDTPVIPSTTMEEADLSPSTPGHSLNPSKEEMRSLASQGDKKPESSVCQQTQNVQGRKRAKTTLPTKQYPTQ